MNSFIKLRRATLGFALLCSFAIFGCDGGASSQNTPSEPQKESSLDAALKKAIAERAKLESQILEKERKFTELRDQFREKISRFDEKERQKIETEFKSKRLSDENQTNAETVRLFGDWKKLLAAEKSRKETRDLYDRLNAAIASGENERDAVVLNDETAIEAVEGLEVLVDSSEDSLSPDDLQLEDDAQDSEIFAASDAETTDSNDVQDPDDAMEADAKVAENLDVWQEASPFKKADDAKLELADDSDEAKRADGKSDASQRDASSVVLAVDEEDERFLTELKSAETKLSRSDSTWFEILVILENADKIESIPQRRARNVELNETLTVLENRLARRAQSDPSGTKTIRKRFQSFVDPKSAAQEKAQEDKQAVAAQKKRALRVLKSYVMFSAVVVFIGFVVLAGVLLRRRRAPFLQPISNVSTPGNLPPTDGGVANPSAVQTNATVKFAVGFATFALGTALGGPLLGIILLFCVGLGFGVVKGRDAVALGVGCLGVCVSLALGLALLGVAAFYVWRCVY